jgi:hypothetical protein
MKPKDYRRVPNGQIVQLLLMVQTKLQLKSQRTKISAHEASLAHNEAGLILAEAQKTQLENLALPRMFTLI